MICKCGCGLHKTTQCATGWTPMPYRMQPFCILLIELADVKRCYVIYATSVTYHLFTSANLIYVSMLVKFLCSLSLCSQFILLHSSFVLWHCKLRDICSELPIFCISLICALTMNVNIDSPISNIHTLKYMLNIYLDHRRLHH